MRSKLRQLGSAAKLRNSIWGAALIAAALGISIVMIVASASRALSSLESTLFQVAILGVGLLGSYIYGRSSADEAARDVVRPHARSAFRRARTLRRSLVRLSARIETMREEGYDHRLDLIHAVVIEQAAVSQDALDDWRDVIPDDVDDIENGDAAAHDIDNLDDADDDDGDDGGSPDWRA